MNEAELEKQAEEYAVEKLREQEHQVCKEGVVNYIAWKTAEVEQAFKDGAKWGAYCKNNRMVRTSNL